MRRPDKMPSTFNRLLFAWSSSLMADGIRFAALPLLALTIDPSPAAVSLVAAALALPWLLVALPAGALVDRLDPARVIAVANLVRAVAVGVVALTVIAGTGHIAVLCAVGFALTSAETFADSAAQSLLVRIVPADGLETANARFLSSENVGFDLVGPLLAGVLFGVEQWLPFVLSAVIFVVAAGLTLPLTGHHEVIDTPTSTPTAGGRHRDAARPSIRDGFRAIFGDPVLRTLVVTVAVLAGVIAAMEGVLVVYSAASLHFSASLYPTLLACYSIGLLFAASVVSRIARRVSHGVLMLVAIGIFGATLILLGVFPHALVAWPSFLVMGAAGGTWNVLSATRRQRRSPRHMMGRVSSAFRTLAWGALPLGAALAGVGGAHWGVPVVFIICGGILLVLGLVVARSFLRPDSADLGAVADGSNTFGTGVTEGIRHAATDLTASEGGTTESPGVSGPVEDEWRPVS